MQQVNKGKDDTCNIYNNYHLYLNRAKMIWVGASFMSLTVFAAFEEKSFKTFTSLA